MRGFISKAFALAVEGDICGFSFLSLSFFLFFSLSFSRSTFPGIFQFQLTEWGISSHALLRPRFYDTIRNNEEPESAPRISYLVSFLPRITGRVPSAVTSVVHAMETANDLVKVSSRPNLGSSKVSWCSIADYVIDAAITGFFAMHPNNRTNKRDDKRHISELSTVIQKFTESIDTITTRFT